MRSFARNLSKALNPDARKVIILGAAGRDFHDFNTKYREDPSYNVVAFTATQIPDIEGRVYPPELSGEYYPEGIPIYDEKDLPNIIKEYDVDECVLSYSDLHHKTVMNLAETILGLGPDFGLIGSESCMLKTDKPCVSVNAVRTGCGKSQTTRKISDYFNKNGIKAIAMRHPMPYGDLVKKICERYAEYDDLKKYDCTIEEMEEYEPYIERGLIIYSGVDYQKILNEAEKEADVILWDGGNNDFPFVKPDLHITIADPFRPGHEEWYHPGEANFKMSDVIIINKVDTAPAEGVKIIEENIKKLNPDAIVVYANSPCTLEMENPESLRGKKVVIVEDGPTLTHGDMDVGAGWVVAKDLECEIIDPRPYAVGSIKSTFEKFTQLTEIIPAMGYGEKQMKELEDTINAIECDAVIIGTPIDLSQHINIKRPSYRVRYDLDEINISLESLLDEHILPLLK